MRLALSVLLLTAAPTYAVDAVVYKGSLGKHEIVVELADTPAGATVGRYSYLAKGGDIPLEAGEPVEGMIVLTEENPCTKQTCTESGNNPGLGAVWTLTSSSDGRLQGTWQPAGSGGALDIVLNAIGRRSLPDGMDVTPYELYDSVFGLTFTVETAPYEFAKMDVALDQGPVETLEGSSFRYVTDPRTKFPFPRIISLADGSSPAAANAALAKQHARINYYAFHCLSQVYSGFGANHNTMGMSVGTLGSFDDENVTLTYLSPTILNWVESGSTYCVGAYPNNHSDTFRVDVRTGGELPLAKIFKDWVAIRNIVDYEAEVVQSEAVEAPHDYRWQAGPALVEYALAHWSPGEDDAYDGCLLDEDIPSYLTLRFLPGDRVQFTIEGLPHVSFACTQDLFTVKLSEIPELLAPTAGDYFPALLH